LRECLEAAEILLPAEIHLKPEEVRLAAAEILVTAEMYLRPEKVHLAAAGNGA
jgi:hypothetical protein